MMSPVRILPMPPPSRVSGDMWMAAGTLPDAPDMRPSVTSATWKPLSCRMARGGVSLCSSGMPLARGPWKRTTQTKSRSSSPRSKAASTSFWSSNTMAGASMMRQWSFTAETFITPRPMLPFITRRPPSGEKGADAGRRTSVSRLSATASCHFRRPSIKNGSCV